MQSEQVKSDLNVNVENLLGLEIETRDQGSNANLSNSLSNFSIMNAAKVTIEQSLDLAKRLESERDHLEKTRDEAQNKHREVERKYHDLLIELNNLKLTDKSKFSELESEVKLKKFEMERMLIVLTETEQKYKTTLLEKERLAEKLDVLKEEYSNSQSESDRKITALTLQLQEKAYRLETYDRLEAELDKVVIQAAALPSDHDADEILAAYGYGASIPSNSKRRLEQSLKLARRVLELENRASEQKKELFTLRDENLTLKWELDGAKSALLHCGTPVTELLELIRKRDTGIAKLNAKIKELEAGIERITKSNFQLQGELTKVHGSAGGSVKSIYRKPDDARTSSTSFISSEQRLVNVRSNSLPGTGQCSSDNIFQNPSSVVHIRKPLSFTKLAPTKLPRE